ncbi:MAG: helix-turn-helix domain-containing protein [Pseudonocardia sp.]|jgi:AraC-like DNA-binding protein|uniref:helix-turn-helix domain-containing protein n=1 Tax=Pseudonocardia sp. TaxID=60912 RepID=UPI001AD3A26C|nr:helix-turn-helix domain-containing protein [Pseudonocardia sp.]MBN9103041.1 helix-turn-helix domain-containing protein [Pseudonocardia sp.]
MRYWTTTDRPAGEQFSYWREVICEAFTPLATERRSAHRPSGPRQPGIESWVRSNALTGTNCAEVVSATQLITHGEAEVRRTDSDHVFVNLQLRGHCVGGQGDRTCLVQPGGFAMFDTTSEYRLEFVGEPATQEWHVVSFRVPRIQLIRLLADPHAFTAVTHDASTGGAASLVASTMMSIWKTVDTLDRSATEAADTAFTALLAAAAGGGDQLRDACRDELDAALRASINRYVVANLRHSDLSAARVARRFGISLRKLHRLYEGTGQSFTQTVMTLRVEGCARELASGTRLSLTELASRWGFCDLSHLNKVFRTRYDCLPSQYRNQAPATAGSAGAATTVR